MSVQVDPTALLGEGVIIRESTVIGPYCCIGLDGPQRLDGSVVGPGSNLRSHTIIYRGTRAGEGFVTGHGVLVREECRIGAGVSIGSHSVLEHSVLVEDHVRIHSGCFIPEHTILRESCWIGPRVTFTNAKYPNRPDTKSHLDGVTVESGAVVGAGSVILPGVVIGEDSVVGAGAVVVRDVAPGAVVAGNPASVIRRSERRA